jgi:hypothetical protein
MWMGVGDRGKEYILVGKLNFKLLLERWKRGWECIV